MSETNHMEFVDRALAALGQPPAARAERITAGYASRLWRVRTENGDLALRLLAPYAEVATELAAMVAAGERGLPVPHVLASVRLDGQDVIAMTWCPGEQLADALRDGPVESLARAFGATQARLHRPGRDGRVVCHGDYHPQNVLAVDGAVSGVVDWSDAYFGDARADLAATWVTLRLIPALAPEWDPAFVPAWQDGYGTFPDDRELAPFVHDAAARQRDIWVARAAGEPALTAVAQAARAIAEDA